LKGLTKGGWHPKGKDGGKETWRGDFKGVNTVAGWMGKGKSPAEAAQDHQSAPLSTLKDPAAFGPPPKHIHFHGAAAAPNSLTPDRGGWGAPLSEEEVRAKERLEEQKEAKRREEEEANKPPPGPYKVNTTGLRVDNLPPPPKFQPSLAAQSTAHPAAKPKLPPRLPPRQNSRPDAHSAAPPPTYNDSSKDPPAQPYINQGAMDRLGQAGVSVPGFGIGRTASPPVPPRQTPSPPKPVISPPAISNRGPQLGELQSRFSKMSTSSPQSPAEPSTGTSFAQKQAALNTASSFREDPSKVSFSDMKSAAGTANNFRERHGEQVASGWRTASGLNQKYGLADRANSLASGGSASAAAPSSPVATSPVHGGLGKKPPPPVPRKKETLASPTGPPPIPLTSKP
ncbi:hypothetical protein BU16DRAFT_425434, partial [Lophium mytilinum]